MVLSSPPDRHILSIYFIPYLIKAPCRPRYDLVPAPALAAAPPAQAIAPWPFRQGAGTSLAGADPENPSRHLPKKYRNYFPLLPVKVIRRNFFRRYFAIISIMHWKKYNQNTLFQTIQARDYSHHSEN